MDLEVFDVLVFLVFNVVVFWFFFTVCFLFGAAGNMNLLKSLCLHLDPGGGPWPPSTIPLFLL